MRKYTKKEYRALKRAGGSKEKNRGNGKHCTKQASAIFMSSPFANYEELYRGVDDDVVKALMVIRDARVNGMTTTSSSSYLF